MANYKTHPNNDINMTSSSSKTSESPDASDSAGSKNVFVPADAFKNFNPAAAEKKICRFIQKEVQKSGAKGVILGLSGGIDSALVAALSSKALDAQNVCAVFFYTAERENAENDVFESADFQDAVSLADDLDVSFQKVNLSPLFLAARQSVLTDHEKNAPSPYALFETSAAAPSPVMLGNLKARLRMSLLYYYANQ